MFSSNQKFEVSGDSKEQLRDCLEFSMKLAKCGSKFDFNNWTDLVFQTFDNSFCLGTVRKDDKDIGKWQRFQFDFDVDIVSSIIWQFLQKQDYKMAEDNLYDGYDGSIDKGFVMRALDTEDAYSRDLDEKIDKMYHGFVYFQPFNSFYAK